MASAIINIDVIQATWHALRRSGDDGPAATASPMPTAELVLKGTRTSSIAVKAPSTWPVAAATDHAAYDIFGIGEAMPGDALKMGPDYETQELDNHVAVRGRFT